MFDNMESMDEKLTVLQSFNRLFKDMSKKCEESSTSLRSFQYTQEWVLAELSSCPVPWLKDNFRCLGTNEFCGPQSVYSQRNV